ncbi:hypothetical protein [Methylobacter luteus]|uniref:hypothetical protein n=1 Tax=Methylobacter luteus TaxID=415 RepID=UPI0012DD2BA2|nr:hypothetical protein [Methylobacter luteus]
MSVRSVRYDRAGHFSILCLFSSLTNASDFYSHCHPDEVTYFSCSIEGINEVASLCSNESDGNETLQFRLGKKGKPSVIYPSDKGGALSDFSSQSNYHHNPIDDSKDIFNYEISFYSQNKMYILRTSGGGDEQLFTGIDIKNGNGSWQEWAEGGWTTYSCSVGSYEGNPGDIARRLE